MVLTYSKEGRRKRIIVLFLAVFFILSGMSFSAQAEDETGGVVAVALQHRVSGGKWVKNLNGLRYKKKSGAYIKNSWVMIGGAVYYFDSKGYVKTGSFTYKGSRYRADTKGKLYINKLFRIGSKTYCYGEDGARVFARWKTIGGKTYYFNRSGAMVKNSWVGNRYVGSNGALVKNRTIQGRTINSEGLVEDISRKDKYIFVGASRIVDMSVAVNSSTTVFIAQAGEGYKWLKRTAYPQLKSYLNKHPKCKVVFNLGNNDIKNLSLYISFYKKIIREYPKVSFYFLDALPGDGASAVKNVKRQIFNNKMKAVFGKRCIGGYDYLMRSGFSTVDGIHYNKQTSQKIYRYVINKISS